MKSKLLVVFSSLIVFTSCELLQSFNSPKSSHEVLKDEPICVWNSSSQENDCKVDYWLKFWYEVEDIPWPERKKQIDTLSEQDTDVFKKVLLSQGKSTPYQDRLRAQGWVELISPRLSQHMRRFILVALYNPSQDMLELESALVTLSKINTQQSYKIEVQQILLKKQQSQIDQLLNIEATIIQGIEKDKQ
tara:strand:+ start:279 stop:848 length:570 start_codon:yes stop_codon:yes gene_type:complete